jgi:hypothetical protein
MNEVWLFHNKSEVREKRRVGDIVYAFTNWGIVKGKIVKERIDRNSGIPQYKLNIVVDKNNEDVDYNFWYTTEQLSKTKFTAIMSELVRPMKVKSINKA